MGSGFFIALCPSQPEWKQQNSSRVDAAEPNSPGLVYIMVPSCFWSSKTTDKRDIWFPVSREGFLETRGHSAVGSANQEQLPSKEQLLFPHPGKAQRASALPKSRDTLPLPPSKGEGSLKCQGRDNSCLLRQMWPDVHLCQSPDGEGTSISKKSRMSSSGDSAASAWLLQDAFTGAFCADEAKDASVPNKSTLGT